MNLLWFITIVFTAAPLSAATLSADEDAVRAWFAKEWAAASKWPDVGLLQLDVTDEAHPRLTDAEYAALKAEVEGRPEHPRKREYETLTTIRRDGPYRFGYLIALGGEERWRFGMTYSSGSVKYFDQALTPKHAWKLTETALEVLDRDAVEAGDPSQDIRNSFRTFLPVVSQLLSGDLIGYAFMGRYEAGAVSVDGPRWKVTLRAGSEPESMTEVHVAGRWDSAAGRGFVETSRIVRSPVAGVAGSTRRFLDWRLDANSGLWWARRVENRGANGVLDRVHVLNGVRRLTDSEFDALVAVPADGREDPWRGMPTFTAVADRRRGTFTKETPTGTVTTKLPASQTFQ